MANWCSNTVVFDGESEAITTIQEVFRTMKNKEDESGQGQLPDFISEDNGGYFFNIYWNEGDEGVFQYETKWSPNIEIVQKIAERPLKTWSLDFMSDVLTNKRKFRTLNIIDDFNRQAIAIEVAHSMPANKVTYLLERIIKEQGKPSRFRTDNGPEFISREFRDWCAGKEIDIQYIQPGRPMQNGYIERFNRTFRESILDAYLFEDTQQVQILAEEWIQDYNYRRPHESLGGKTPMEYDALPAACYQ